jgi:DNA-binding MarR family transcriptional regulator
VLLPPITAKFLADELGCRPAQADALLDELVREGLLVVTDGPRYRVPEPKALLRSGFS